MIATKVQRLVLIYGWLVAGCLAAHEGDHGDADAWYLRRNAGARRLQQQSTSSTAKNNIGLQGPFQLQLYWTPTSCWHGDCETRSEWCMNCEGMKCNDGDVLWIEPCRFGVEQQLFYWRNVMEVLDTTSTITASSSRNDTATEARNSGQQVQARQGLEPPSDVEMTVSVINYGQLIVQVEDASAPSGYMYLCLDRISINRYQLQPCIDHRQRQWFQGFRSIGTAFEMRPMDMYPIDRTKPKCVTMHHHPRHYEQMLNAPCLLAEKYHTSYWIATLPTDAQGRRDDTTYYALGYPRHDPRCLSFDPCGMCQGDCHDDTECIGELKCFERTWENEFETPPGCYGKGVSRIGYCFAADGN